METSGSWVRPCLRAGIFATHYFGPQHCSQTGGGVGPAPSTGSVGDNSHNYSGRWLRREGNWRWDPVPVMLWQVMVPRDPVNLTTPLLTPAWYPCGSGISNPLHQCIVPCSGMSSTEGVTITLSLLDTLQHRGIGLCPAGATALWAPRWVGVGGTNINKNMDAEPHSKQRRTTKWKKADESESEESSSAPESQNFPKFIIIIPTGPKTISDLSPFWIQKALQASIGTLTSVRKTRAGYHSNGERLLQSEAVGPHRSGGSPSEGWAPPNSQLLQRGHQMLRLKRPDKGRDCWWPTLAGRTDYFHITVKSDNNNTDRRKTNTFILTFNTDLRLTSMLDTFVLRWIDT